MQSKKLAQIKQQIARLERQAEKVRKAGIKGVVKQIMSLMEEHGISLSDIGKTRGRPGRKPGRKPGRPAKAAAATKPGRKPGRPPKATAEKAAAKTAAKKAAKPASGKAQAKAKPKYRSPDNAKLVWTGRGRPPTWVKSWVDAGKKIDDLLIK